MADIFLTENVGKLLKGKRVIFFGDSNIRHIYKDLVWLANENSIIPSQILRRKLEASFKGDKLVKSTKLTQGRWFKENRQFTGNGFCIEYVFITRCLNEDVKKYTDDIKTKKIPAPDVIIMNSTLWDITRWGPGGVNQFKTDLRNLMILLSEVLPKTSMFIWTTALPPGKAINKGSLLIKQVEFLEHTVRFDVMEANLYARDEVVKFGYDLLDFHYHVRMQVHRRNPDGLHYSPIPVRLLTNVLLTHLALSWGQPLPKNVNNSLLDRYIQMGNDIENDNSFDNVIITNNKNNNCNNISNSNEVEEKNTNSCNSKDDHAKPKTSRKTPVNHKNRNKSTWLKKKRLNNRQKISEQQRNIQQMNYIPYIPSLFDFGQTHMVFPTNGPMCYNYNFTFHRPYTRRGFY